jgi:drug/metabolite transporter (DMT)-like permease
MATSTWTSHYSFSFAGLRERLRRAHVLQRVVGFTCLLLAALAVLVVAGVGPQLLPPATIRQIGPQWLVLSAGCYLIIGMLLLRDADGSL